MKSKLWGIPRSLAEIRWFIRFPFDVTYSLEDYEAKYQMLNKLDHPSSLVLGKYANLTKIYDNGYEELWSSTD